MPVHDWTKVDDGTFHHFRNGWIMRISDFLNGGTLPDGYYAMVEQHSGRVIGGVLALHTGEEDLTLAPTEDDGGVAVMTAPPRVSRKVSVSVNATYRNLRKTIAIRHVSGHRVVALIEIISPGNKDRESSVADFAEKAQAALRAGVHLLVVDLFSPGSHDPHGIHCAIWERFDSEDLPPPADKPLMQASYEAGPFPEAYLEPFAVGDALTDMPLFLKRGGYVNVLLDSTYQAAFASVPAVWRRVLEN